MSNKISELVELAKGGDDAELSALVRLYHTPAQRVAQNILKDPDLAEDVVQDTWILALRKLDTLRSAVSFGNWFYRIVSNIALRRRQSKSLVTLDLADTTCVTFVETSPQGVLAPRAWAIFLE